MSNKMFSNVFVVGYKRYKALPLDERAVVNTFIIILLLLSIATALLEFVREKHWLEPASSFVIIFTAIAISSMVAITYSLFDRLSIIAPIESKLVSEISRLGDLTSETANEIGEMKAEFANYEQRAENAMARTMSGFQHYDKYALARSKFGFNALIGLDVQKDPGDPNISVSREPFALKLFNHSVPQGGSISYLISFITDDQVYADAIEIAVRRGVHVRLLLMRPTPETPPAEARWRDCYFNDDQYDIYEEFISEVAEKYRKFWRLERKLKYASPKPSGSFALRAYDASLSIPLLVVKEDRRASLVDSVYTGFYTTLDSNDMPFVEWRGGDYRIGTKFSDTFENKWDRAKPFNPTTTTREPGRSRTPASSSRETPETSKTPRRKRTSNGGVTRADG